MKQPTTHDRAHPIWCDRWNPYREREDRLNLIDTDTFSKLNSYKPEEFISVTLFMHGCLDAPDEIPCGSTLNSKTVGGWQREHYNRRHRECDDWQADERAVAKTAAMLRRILESTET